MFVLGNQKGSLCIQCGKEYKFMSSLNRHLKYECQKEPSYVCPLCFKKAHLRSNLLQHIRLVHHLTTKEIQSGLAIKPS